MRSFLALLALVAVAGTSSASAQSSGSLTISGTSTVRDWSCTTSQFTVHVTPARGFEDQVLGGNSAVSELHLTFPIDAIDCGNGKMNEHLQKALKADAHPTITYALSSYEIAKAAQGVAVTSKGDLTISGRTKPVAMNVVASRNAAGGLRVKGKQAIRMTEFGVKPPTLMLGSIKVADEITVSFDVILGQ